VGQRHVDLWQDSVEERTSFKTTCKKSSGCNFRENKPVGGQNHQAAFDHSCKGLDRKKHGKELRLRLVGPLG
jgi:hypothetical protein